MGYAKVTRGCLNIAPCSILKFDLYDILSMGQSGSTNKCPYVTERYGDTVIHECGLSVKDGILYCRRHTCQTEGCLRAVHPKKKYYYRNPRPTWGDIYVPRYDEWRIARTQKFCSECCEIKGVSLAVDWATGSNG